MPRSVARTLARLAAVLLGGQCLLLAFTGRAAAATPSPSPSPRGSGCGLIGPGNASCSQGNTLPGPSAIDPMASLARGCADAASWVIGKLSGAIESTTQVDFTNTSFLRQYSVVFAASTILTVLLWLLAVAKRAVRGAPLHTALSEAIGFLWLTVIASAFTPLVLYTVVKVTDAVTNAIGSGTRSDTHRFFGSFADALQPNTSIGGGPIMLIVVSLISVLAASLLWLELVARAAMLYVGAMLGTAVYAGLVDRSLWSHVRRWAGLMVAVDLVKPVIVVVMSLAGAVASSDDPKDDFSAVLSGLAIIILSIVASGAIYRFVPGFGDDIMHGVALRRGAARVASAVVNGPATMVSQGIRTHGARPGSGASEPSRGGTASGGGSPSSVSAGVAAHSTRGTAPARRPASSTKAAPSRAAPPETLSSETLSSEGGKA